MNFEIGKHYRARNGQIFIIENIDSSPHYPIKARSLKGDRTLRIFTNTGKYSITAEEYEYDLLDEVSVNKEPELPGQATRDILDDETSKFRDQIAFHVFKHYLAVDQFDKSNQYANISYSLADAMIARRETLGVKPGKASDDQ